MMQFKWITNVLSAVVVLSVLQVCHSQDASQLMCYVCEDCLEVKADTPLEACNEDFFNPHPSTTTTPDQTTDTTKSTSTTTDSTMHPSDSTATTSDKSTEPPVPTPPTAGPPQTTTAMPTPPNVGTVIIPDELDREHEPMNTDSMTTSTPSAMKSSTSAMMANETFMANSNSSSSDNSSSSSSTPSSGSIRVPPAETTLPPTSTSTSISFPDMNKTLTLSTGTSLLHVRQLRQVLNTDVTYHCYRARLTQNGTTRIERGCSRVATNEGVCNQLRSMNMNSTVTKCTPCTRSQCNGSNALAISFTLMIVGVVAVLLRRY